MSESVTDTNNVETQAPPPVIEGEGEATTADQTPSPADQRPPTGRSWAEKRIQDLVAARAKAEERARLAEERAARLEAARSPAATEGEPPATSPPSPANAGRTDPSVEQAAAELVRIREYNAACDQVYETGTKEYRDFSDVLRGYGELGGLTPMLIEAVLEADRPNAHKILYELGKDKDKAYDVLRITSPVKLGLEVAKLAEKHKPKPSPQPVSAAPAPPEPLRNTRPSPPAKDPSEMSTAEWMEWRKKNKAVR